MRNLFEVNYFDGKVKGKTDSLYTKQKAALNSVFDISK